MIDSSFGFDIPEENPGFLLWQTIITWQCLIKNASDVYKNSHAQFVILAVLLWFEGTKQEIIQAGIINKTKLDKMTLSKALKKLEVEGLVDRNEHRRDTRAKSVCLTKRERTLTKKLIPIAEAIDREFFGTIKNGDKQQLIYFLHCLADGTEV